jgi:hypothetical protein
VRKSEISEQDRNCLHNTTTNIQYKFIVENTRGEEKCVIAWSRASFLPSMGTGRHRHRRLHDKQQSRTGAAVRNRGLAGAVVSTRCSRVMLGQMASRNQRRGVERSSAPALPRDAARAVGCGRAANGSFFSWIGTIRLSISIPTSIIPMRCYRLILLCGRILRGINQASSPSNGSSGGWGGRHSSWQQCCFTLDSKIGGVVR